MKWDKKLPDATNIEQCIQNVKKTFRIGDYNLKII